MTILMHMGGPKANMGDFTLPLPRKIVGWFATGVMPAAAVGMMATLIA